MYACSECGSPATVEDGVVTRTCDHDAPVTASASVTLHGKGGVKA